MIVCCGEALIDMIPVQAGGDSVLKPVCGGAIFNTAARMILPEVLPGLPPQASTYFFGGISLCSTPAADTWVDLAERVSSQAVVVLDPNIRASFIVNEAAYRVRLRRLFTIADIIKVSDEDLAWIIPGDISEGERVALFRSQEAQRNTNLIIVTRGGERAQAYLAGGEQVFVGPAV